MTQNNWSYHYNILVAFLLGTGDSLLQSAYIAKQDLESMQLSKMGQFHNFSTYGVDSEISALTLFSMLFFCVR